MAQVIELVEDFSARGLRPGLYVAASDGDAYGPLLALIEAGGATFLGENIDTRGRKMVAARVGARRNPSIGISREFFTTVLKDYDDWQEKWWREAVQNAVDAGANKLRCEAIENPDGTWSISVEDNGGGMDENVLIDKFLMLGGTTKVGAAGVAGGFGKAKELLILPWLTWEVHTRDKVVKGSGVDYVIEDAPMLKGTKITVVMPADQHTSAASAVSFIEKSYLPGVRFDVKSKPQEGTGWESTVRAKMKAKDLLETVLGKADIYVTKVKYDPWTMLVRVNGIYMFSIYIGTMEKRQVIVEITAPSIEILTANRDGFRDRDVRNAVSKLGERVAKDVRSALRAKSGLIRKKYEGSGKFQAQERQTQALAEIGPVGPTTKGVVAMEKEDVVAISDVSEQIRQESRESAPAIPNRELATVLLSTTTFNGGHHVEEAVRQLVWEPDFFLINEIEDFRVPKKFKPETMAPRMTKLSRTWTELCRYVLMQLGNYRSYGVGFIFSESTAAAYLYEDGESWLLLNPFKDLDERKETWSPTKKSDLKWLYAAAVHECTHLADGVTYHDEAFAAALTYNIAKTADGFKHVGKIVRSIRMKDEAVADVPRGYNPNPTIVTQADLVGRLKF